MLWSTLSREPPLIIAHRGASGLFPEHTIKSYSAAIAQGADFIEPDLVITRDGYLVALHDPFLSSTTDVTLRPKFQNKKRWSWKFRRYDWFVEDFTLAELTTLRVRQRRSERSHAYDGKYTIPTFDEVAMLAATSGTDRSVGLFPEVKYLKHFKRLGFDFVPSLLTIHKKHSVASRSLPMIVQSFDSEFLKCLRMQTEIPLMLLLNKSIFYSFCSKSIARYATAIGPEKSLVAKHRRSTGLLESAHQQGLQVFIYTIRDDHPGPDFKNVEEELEFYFRLGVDGVFTDHPQTAVRLRAAFMMK